MRFQNAGSVFFLNTSKTLVNILKMFINTIFFQDLVSLDKFYKDAPEEIADEDKIGGNEHLERLARLEYEKLQREEQSEQLKTFEHEKEALESHISKKQENLSNLKPQLSTILQATEPVQKLLKMPLNEERDQMEKAKYLPRPLFVMFSETRAYGQACGKICIFHFNYLE